MDSERMDGLHVPPSGKYYPRTNILCSDNLFFQGVICCSQPNGSCQSARIWTIQMFIIDVTGAACSGCHGGGGVGSMFSSLANKKRVTLTLKMRLTRQLEICVLLLYPTVTSCHFKYF